MQQEKFIELDRDFYSLEKAENTGSEISEDIIAALSINPRGGIKWPVLLQEFRAVILSEAGSGKTEEILQTALKLRKEGKKAFFLRLEHITQNFASAFEEGNINEFNEWLNSSEEAWILLDSIDEARLKGPKDFEAAIRVIQSKAAQGLQRAHIILTSRAHAWRAVTDLAFCNKHLPVGYGRVSKLETTEDGIDVATETDLSKSGFKIFSLKDLTKAQASHFIKSRSIENSDDLISAIEKQDAWGFTTRPQDLEELIAYWTKNKKLGSRSELIEFSIKCRLQERDQARAEATSLSEEKVEQGGQLLSACATFTHENTIIVPDGTHNSNAIRATEVLPDWSEPDCRTLLGRPIFDEAIYGTVRFHHRSVREYLTAKWISELLKGKGSRQRIENLFFCKQYGLLLIPQSMRPILEWLVLWDEKIRERTWKIQPEIILTCGDPTLLPLPFRVKTLESVCESIAQVHSYNEVSDRAAIERFAQSDMSEIIIKLLNKYSGSDEVIQFLLQMVWRGQLVAVLPEALKIALNSNENIYSRIIAIRVVKECGESKDFQQVLQSLDKQAKPHSRRLIGELVSHLDSDKVSVDWLLKVIEEVEDVEKYHVDGLANNLEKYVSDLNPELSAIVIKKVGKLLKRAPFIERIYCNISEKYSWLANAGVQVAQNLITARDPSAMSSECLYLLAHIKALSDHDYRECKDQLSELIPKWPELNRKLFWFGIYEARTAAQDKKKVTSFWDAWCFANLWLFTLDDSEYLIECIKKRPILDDKLVALSLAFRVYQDNGRPRQVRERLKKTVAGIPELERQLAKYLKPPAQSAQDKKWKAQSRAWKRQGEEKKQRDKEAREEWREKLKVNLGWLTSNEFNLKGQINQAQHGLHEVMRGHKENSSKWTEGNWRDLIEEFGEEVAKALRSGLIDFWRNYKPKFRSEDDSSNGTAISIIFGLSGLEIESRENPEWLENLTKDEALLALRYAVHELNGFPNWFDKIFNKYPDICKEILMQEIKWELEVTTKVQERHYILSRVSWGYQWLWPHIAGSLLGIMKSYEPDNVKTLEHVLKIVQGNKVVTDGDLAHLAEFKCNSIDENEHLAYWYAVWIGVDPQRAIAHFSTYLSGQPFESAKEVAMSAIVQLVGERRAESSVRSNFKTPEHLKNLYLLMHQYVRIEEDIDRANGGVYSPTLRDNAQDARSGLFTMLTDISGKESYLAQMAIAESYPQDAKMPWMLRYTKQRAQKDAEQKPWTVKQFNEFKQHQERTPENHRELYDLAVQRIYDFKHECEEGDNSNAKILIGVTDEVLMRGHIAGWFRTSAQARYSVPQEDELADAKRPDIRFYGVGFDGPVPVEIKLADNGWSGPALFERLKNQLCEDYLRDNRSNNGIFLLVYRGEKGGWELPETGKKVDFAGIVNALKNYWTELSPSYPQIENIEVIGIDLTKRFK